MYRVANTKSSHANIPFPLHAQSTFWMAFVAPPLFFFLHQLEWKDHTHIFQTFTRSLLCHTTNHHATLNSLLIPQVPV